MKCRIRKILAPQPSYFDLNLRPRSWMPMVIEVLVKAPESEEEAEQQYRTAKGWEQPGDGPDGFLLPPAALELGPRDKPNPGGRTCEKCGRPLLPVQVATDFKLEVGVYYPDNLWALDGMAGEMTRAWGCRGTCVDPTPIGDTAEALEEWQKARDEATKSLDGRPLRTPEVG